MSVLEKREGKKRKEKKALYELHGYERGEGARGGDSL